MKHDLEALREREKKLYGENASLERQLIDVGGGWINPRKLSIFYRYFSNRSEAQGILSFILLPFCFKAPFDMTDPG